MLLPANGDHGDETGACQSFEFALQGASPGHAQSRDFIGVERSVRLAEEQAKHTLLPTCEKNV